MATLQRLISTVVFLGVLAAAGAVSASGDSLLPAAGTHDLPNRTSPNWAGYVVNAPATAFTSVTATWKQPRGVCGDSNHGSAASFWVGLGGSTPGAPALEQAGTASDCSASGVATYHAWYEVVPGPPITVDLAVRPGDTITASVNMLQGGAVALFQIKNRSRRTAATARVTLASPPDLSSADWIAEAPTQCTHAFCLPVPLQEFGTLSFSKIAALGNGIGGTLSHLGWVPEGYQLAPSTVFVSGAGQPDAAAGAIPAGVTRDGRSFNVLWVPRGGSGPDGL